MRKCNLEPSVDANYTLAAPNTTLVEVTYLDVLERTNFYPSTRRQG